MTRTVESGWRLSLGLRLILAFALVLVLAVGGALLISLRLIEQVALDQARSALNSSQSVQRYFQDLRGRQLELISELIASDPYFSGYVGEAIALDDQALAARSIADLLQQSRNEFGLDLAMVLKPDGEVLARTDRTALSGQRLADEPLVAAAIGELDTRTGLWLIDGRIHQATVLPIVRARTVVGFLVTSLAIDDRLANDVKRVSGADVVYLIDREGPQILATTLDVAGAEELRRRLRALTDPGALDRGTILPLAGDRWLIRRAPLENAAGDRIGWSVALSSVDRQTAAFRTLPWWLLVTGLVAIAVAMLTAWLLSRRIVQPIRELTALAEAASGGDYHHRIDAHGDDEIARLARAFNALLSELREKQDMEEFMVDMIRHAPGGEASGTAQGTTVAEARRPSTRTLERMAEQGRPVQDTERSQPTQPTPGGDRSGGLVRSVIEQKLGRRYSLLDEIGRGAMGVVYRAEDRELDEIVALKLLKINRIDASHLDQLKREIKLARRITHPNVLRTYDFGMADDLPFISMEYVNGLTLRQLLSRRGRLPYGAALRIARQLAAGLNAVHEVGVLHRDIKPGNIMVEPRGNAKLMDFGIARPALERLSPTDYDTITGTPEYLSPEQLQGKPPSVRSDLYALGVVFEEMFTGGMPFEGPSPMQAAIARVKNDPIPPSVHWPEIPPELEAIILRLLARNPEQRFADAKALYEALAELRG